MSKIRFICPSCGHRAKYDRAIGELIYLSVCQNMEVDPVAARKKCKHNSREGRARALSVYFTRAYTGEMFKICGETLGISATQVGSMIVRVEAALESPGNNGDKYRRDFFYLDQVLRSELWKGGPIPAKKQTLIL